MFGCSSKERGGPYLIAEIGVNHFDIADQRNVPPIEAAKTMVAEAADAGVDAVKFQSYSADTLASKRSPVYWDTSEEATESQYELFRKYDDFGREEFEELAAWTIDEYNVDFLSTPFDFHAVEYLEDLVPAYKVASADLTNHPLLRDIASRGKPILLSTGASHIGEIDEATRCIRSVSDDPEIYVLHCVLEYPTDPRNANLAMIEHLADCFPEHAVGYSDHVPPDESMVTLLNAYVRGADVLEKHFTLDKALEGNDHYHAMDPDDVRRFRSNVSVLEETTGDRVKRPLEVEHESRQYARRSLVAATDLRAGEELKRDSIAIKRPGTGISPTLLDTVVGRTVKRDVDADAVLTWEDV